MKNLAELRQDITQIDEELLQLFAKRFTVVEEVGEYKKANNLPVRDKKREDELLGHLAQKGSGLKLSSDFIQKVWQAVFQEAYKKEE